MACFFNILSKQLPEIDLIENPFTYHINRPGVEISKMDFITYAFLSNIKNDAIYNKLNHKFYILKNTILENTFITKTKQEYILNKFYLAQKLYHSFCKLAYKYKIKKAKIFSMDMDLYLSTSLSSLPPSVVISLYDEPSKTIYRFRLSDLITIIKNDLSNAPDFFVEPQSIKNPYTNIPFTNAQLYSIYFKISDSLLIMPTLFQLFYSNNFDLQEFTRRNECIIRDYAIKSLLKGANTDLKHKYTLKMLRTYNNLLPNIIIDPSFPKKKLVKVFTSYLEYYLITRYSLNPSLRFFSKEKLRLKLIKFNKLNPTFGRKIWKRIEKPILENKIISCPISQINTEGIFIFGSNTAATSNFQTRPHTVYSFVDTVINEPAIIPISGGVSRVRRSRAQRRRLAHYPAITNNPPNIINTIDSDDDIPEILDNLPDSDTDDEDNLPAVTYDSDIIRSIMSILPNRSL
tara:strand:+ start:5326 stop:6705 length:1380 start_codon:yes stop_codon:yes gene_type:complete